MGNFEGPHGTMAAREIILFSVNESLSFTENKIIALFCRSVKNSQVARADEIIQISHLCVA